MSVERQSQAHRDVIYSQLSPCKMSLRRLFAINSRNRATSHAVIRSKGCYSAGDQRGNGVDRGKMQHYPSMKRAILSCQSHLLIAVSPRRWMMIALQRHTRWPNVSHAHGEILSRTIIDRARQWGNVEKDAGGYTHPVGKSRGQEVNSLLLAVHSKNEGIRAASPFSAHTCPHQIGCTGLIAQISICSEKAKVKWIGGLRRHCQQSKLHLKQANCAARALPNVLFGTCFSFRYQAEILELGPRPICVFVCRGCCNTVASQVKWQRHQCSASTR